MNSAMALIASGCVMLGLGLGMGTRAAFADSTISIQKGVKLCEAQMKQLQPALRSFAVDYEDSRGTPEQFAIAFKATNAEGRLDRFVCTVDRRARTAAVALKARRTTDFTPPVYAGGQELAQQF